MTRAYACMILMRAEWLRAAADRTENVEQLEAIERDFEKLIEQANRVAANVKLAKARTPNLNAGGVK